MAANELDLSKTGFFKTFVLPALLIFLVPTISLLFFLHARNVYDANLKTEFLQAVDADQKIEPETRSKLREVFENVPVSRMIDDPAITEMIGSETKFNYVMFRWFIRFAFGSIVAGIVLFALAGLLVLLSRRSQQAQYWSLSVGWQLLRLFGAAQTILQGAMLVGLSFWVTALWMNVYIPKIILLVAILAGVGIFAVLKAMFQRINLDHEVEGRILERGESPRLWQELERVCEKVGTEMPDRIVVGIDDNFFVTQTPIKINGSIHAGRTLYVSLALLKQLEGAEADAVLAHEMAHFSGNDTLYSKKIAPLLNRNAYYLHALYQNIVTRPIFYFMHCFHVLFSLSLSEHSREREFRADRIASEVTTKDAMAGALLRILAYANFRGQIQNELFEQERAIESANIADRIERDFHAYARSFSSRSDLGDLATTHPFDSHPSLAKRLEAIGIPFELGAVGTVLHAAGDGRWFHLIDGAADLERQQWDEFEARFRAYHEQTLAYRFLPETDEERALVTQAFPDRTFEGKKDSLALTCDTIKLASWPGDLKLADITNLALNEKELQLSYLRNGKPTYSVINMKIFGKDLQTVLQYIGQYHHRSHVAVAYQKQKKAEGKTTPEPSALSDN